MTAPVSDQTDKEFGPGQVAAPKVPLFSKGQLSVYGKCFETQTPEATDSQDKIYVADRVNHRVQVFGE